MSLKNIDDMLVADMTGLVPEPVPLVNDEPVDVLDTPVYLAPNLEESEPEVVKEEAVVDDYGTEVIKQERVYTESEVQAMIRERVSRMKQPSSEPQHQAVAPQNFEYDANNSDSWEAQLEAFNESWFNKRQQREMQVEQQRREEEANANFEMKFNQGAAKYADFEQVVLGKPLTPQMVTATRGMDNPAAFIYAAAKTQSAELERISKIYDPFAQAIELGRLEERMRKARPSTTQAPRPIDTPKGDVSEKVERTWSIDDKLRQIEKQQRQDRLRR